MVGPGLKHIWHGVVHLHSAHYSSFLAIIIVVVVVVVLVLVLA